MRICKVQGLRIRVGGVPKPEIPFRPPHNKGFSICGIWLDDLARIHVCVSGPKMCTFPAETPIPDCSM